MRRHGGLWPMVTDIENIHLAFHKAALHKSKHKGVIKTKTVLDERLEEWEKFEQEEMKNRREA